MNSSYPKIQLILNTIFFISHVPIISTEIRPWFEPREGLPKNREASALCGGEDFFGLIFLCFFLFIKEKKENFKIKLKAIDVSPD